MPELTFDALPQISHWRALWPRKRGLRAGETLPHFSVRFDGLRANQLEAYRAICGFGEGGPLPLPYPQVAAAPLHMALLTHPEFPLPAMGLVHVASEIRQERPIPSEASLSVHCHVEGQRPARRGVEIDLITEIEVEGEAVWRSVTTILSRAALGTGEAQPPAPALEFDPASEGRWALPADLGRRYGRIAGDRNPIHLYAWTAKVFGFKRAIAHGMWTLSRAVAELEDAATSEGPVRLDTQFKRPVFLPSEPKFLSGPKNNGTAFQLVDPQTGKTHLQGWLGRV